MKIKVSLTGDQLKELVEKFAPYIDTEISVEVDLDLNEAKQFVGTKEQKDIIKQETAINEPSLKDWPNPKKSDPAKNLIKSLKAKRDDGEIQPSALADLSYQRVIRLCRTDYQKMRHGLYIRRVSSAMHRNVNEVEKTLGVRFKQYNKPTDEFIELFKSALPNDYDSKKLAEDIHALKSLLKPSKNIPNPEKEFKGYHFQYVLYIHGIYTITDLKTLTNEELKEDSILEKMYYLAWLND